VPADPVSARASTRDLLAVVSVSDPSPRLLRRLLAALCFCAIAMSASASDVWVVTDQQHPVKTTAGVRVIELDAPSRIQRELSAQLPPDPQRAAALVQQRLQHGGPDLQRRLTAAYQGVVDAWQLGVTKVPAVVVDQRYVVYGESNVARAVSWIETYRRTHP
jgi:integrating conjugative element protein (TIGR03757 family)